MKPKTLRWIEAVFAAAVFVTLFVLVLLSIGCGSLLPEKRTEGASVKATESIANTQNLAVERITRGTQPPQVTVSGASNNVALHYDSGARLTSAPRVTGSTALPPSSEQFSETITATSGTSTDSKFVEAAKANLSVSVPLFVSLIGCAIGILLLLFAFKKVRDSSAATKAAFNMADETLARHIENARNRAIAATDFKDIAAENARIAAYEKERGKLALHRAPPKP